MDGIVFIGNPPMFPSGYGKQLALLQKHLEGKFHMAHICDYGYDGPSFEYNGVTVYGVAEHPGVLTTKHIDKCITNFLKSKPIDKWIVIGLGNLYNRGILEQYPSLLLSVVESADLTQNELHSLSTSIPIAISEFGKSVILANGLDCPFIVPHGVDTAILPTKSSAALRSTKDWPFPSTRMFVVGFFGDFSIRKSPEALLNVWPSFCEDKTDVALWIHHSNHTDMDHKTLHFLQQFPNVYVSTTEEGWNDRQMLEKLKTLDCLFHPSNREGFGVFQAEAQCVGTPVVSFDAGPAREINVNPEFVSPTQDFELNHRLNFIYSQWSTKNYQLNQETQTKAIELFSPNNAFASLNSAISYAYREYYPPVKHSPPVKLNHICIISTYGIDCGIATYTKMLATRLSKTHKITILAEGQKSNHRDGDLDVIYCWDRNYPSGGAILGVLDALQPDIVHIQHETSLFKMQQSLLTEIYGVDAKIVTTLHTPDFAKNEIVETAKQSDLTILHNQPLAQKMNGSLPNAVQHIPHGVELILTTSDRQQTGVPSGIPLLFNFGFCSPSKGVFELVRAAKMLKQGELKDSTGEPLTTTHFELVIYATKSNKEYFERCQTEAQGVDGIVLSDDVLPEEGIDFWASTCDFVVFPYTSANHPFQINSTSGAAMRVLSAGKPVIATDEGRLRDLIGGIHGWKCSMGSVEDLALCLREAINQFNFDKKSYEKMCGQVRELAERFSWEKVANKHIECYSKLSKLHHYRTKNPILSPRARNVSQPHMLLRDGEEE